MFDMLAAEDVCIFSLEDIGGDKLDLSINSCISFSVRKAANSQNLRMVKGGKDLRRSCGLTSPSCSSRSNWSQLPRTMSRWLLYMCPRRETPKPLWAAHSSSQSPWLSIVWAGKVPLEKKIIEYFW